MTSPGGQWTRDDLPSVMDLVKASVDATAIDPSGGADAALDAVVAHLNTRHPKPQPYDQGGVRGADSLLYRAERERDAAVARAKQSEMLANQRAEMVRRAKRQRDEWRARAEQAENARDTAATRAEQLEKALSGSRDAHQRSADAHMEWKARAENLELELAEFKRNANRLNTPAVVRDVVEAELVDGLHRGFTAEQLARRVCAAIDSDPAVHVIRESDLPEAYRGERVIFNGERVRHWWTRDGDWIAHEDESADVVRREGMRHLVKAARHEAVARAIEAEQAVDPVEEKARELAKAGGVDFDEQEPEGVDMLMGMARHVLGQEATR